jgi:hypothetical protein
MATARSTVPCWTPLKDQRRRGLGRYSPERSVRVATRKVQRVGRDEGRQEFVGTCACGGTLVWTRLVLNRARMVKACVRCGAIEEKDRT